MVERDVEVEAVDVAAGSVSVRLIGGCRGCGGCSGRCGLLDVADAGHARVELKVFPRQPDGGERWRLALDDSALHSAAAWGYGLPLLGMLSGAAAGYALGVALGSGVDGYTLLGAVAGTSLAFLQSKRAAPEVLPTALRWTDTEAVAPAIPSAEYAADPHPSKEF